MTAYYNEIDPFAAAWLRNLIAAGLIAPGEVDTRSIADVRATDLVGFVQCHFFAGIGGWGLALRMAGWPDDRPVWTGSCPCQPFSAAGKRKGATDERHLWPVAFELIRECRPPILFGEQVAGKAGLAWFAAVRADLERIGYAVGAADLAAASVGAPHIRQRLFFGAVRLSDADGQRRDGIGLRLRGRRPREDRAEARRGREADGLPDAHGAGLAGLAGRAIDGGDGVDSPSTSQRGLRGVVRGLSDAESIGWGEGDVSRDDADDRARPADGDRMGDADRESAGRNGGGAHRAQAAGEGCRRVDGAVSDEPDASGGARGPWSDVEWLVCRDGKARPTQPGIHPLAHGVPGRVGMLRAAGNAIVPEVAAEFIGTFLDAMTEPRAA